MKNAKIRYHSFPEKLQFIFRHKDFATSNFHHHARHAGRKFPFPKHQFCTTGTNV